MAPGTVILGKRKRRVPTDKAAANVDAKVDEAAALEEAQAIFRKHFEAQFAPLEGSDDDEDVSRPAAKDRRKAAAGKGRTNGDGDDAAGVEDMRSEDSDSGEEDDDSQDEWDGLSAEDDDCVDSEDDEADDDNSEGDETESGSETEETNNHQVEVVDYSKPTPAFSTLTPQTALMTKREMRAFLSSRPPDAVSSVAEGSSRGNARSKQQQGGDGNDDPQNEDSRSLLANDLELQRLISESHILSATNPFNTAGSGGAHAPSKTFSEGRTRALTTDLRLQKLGSSGSIFKQQKMPMAMRKGITGAKASREEKRRREAKENGIILERETPGEGGGKKARRKQQQQGGRRSDLPVDMPGMGRMKGGELRLSKRDVRAVEMEGKRMGDSRGGKGKKHRKRR